MALPISGSNGKKATRRCPCGYHGDPRRQCTCTPFQVRNYLNRVSGPLMDRIDIQVEVPAVPFKELSADTAGPGSVQVRQNVMAARQQQEERLTGSGIFCNAQMTTAQTRKYCRLSNDGLKLLETAMERLQLSAWAYGRIHKIARTIADLERADNIGLTHISEAIGYRSLDRVVA